MSKGDIPHEERGADPPDVAQARAVYEQFLFVWQDQVEFAETLREKRKLYSTAMALIAALGVFRFAWYRGAGEVPVIPSHGSALIVKLMIAGSLGLLLLGGHYLYTERPMLGPAFTRTIEWALSSLGLQRSSKRSRRDGGAEEAFPLSAGFGTDDSTRAIAVCALEPDEADQWMDGQISMVRIWRERAERLRLAYNRLLKANTRVDQRISRGIFLIGAGYILLAVTFVAYTFLI